MSALPQQPVAPATPAATGKRPSKLVGVRIRPGSAGSVGTAYAAAVQIGAGGQIRVTDTATAPADATSIAQLVQRLSGGEQAVIVMPESAAIVRPVGGNVQLGSGEQAIAALALLAEAQLPETLPAHRRAAGVLRHGAARSIYAIGWTGDPGTRLVGATYVPTTVAIVGALRALLPQGGVLAIGDEASGVVTLAACRSSNEGPLIVRSVRPEASEHAENDGGWPSQVASVADETAEVLEIEAQWKRLGSLVLSDDAADVPGLSSAKVSDFALAVGAAAFVLAAQQDETPLLGMLPDAPIIRRAPGVSLLERFGTPGRLAAIAAASIVLLLAGYVGAQHLRLWALQKRAGVAESGESAAAFRKAVDQQQLLSLQREKRWPMTHLLAQIGAGMPQGVLIEQLAMETGRSVSITATAPSAEDVNQWRATLLADRTFAEVTVPQQTPLNDGTETVRFTVTARVTDALAGVKASGASLTSRSSPASAKTEPATTTTPSVAPIATTPRTSNGETPRATRTRGERTAPATATPATPGPTTPATPRGEAPPPITEAQIAKLTMSQATIEWAKRRGPSQSEVFDEATRARLATEVDLLQRRRDELRSAGGGGGS